MHTITVTTHVLMTVADALNDRNEQDEDMVNTTPLSAEDEQFIRLAIAERAAIITTINNLTR